MTGDIQQRFKERYGDQVKSGADITTPLFHISFHHDREGLWVPKVPDSPFDTPNNPSTSYEMPLPRICVAPTIEQCFWAIYPNISHYFEEEGYSAMHFAVYRALLSSGSVIVDTESLTRNQLVHDAHVTGEHWILSDTWMVHADSIRIDNTSCGEFVKFLPYNHPDGDWWDLAPKEVKYQSIQLLES